MEDYIKICEDALHNENTPANDVLMTVSLFGVISNLTGKPIDKIKAELGQILSEKKDSSLIELADLRAYQEIEKANEKGIGSRWDT